jgi:hypothetical protein
MNTAIRAATAALLIGVATVVSGCQLSFQPVDLNVIDSQRSWPDNHAGGRVEPPAGR